MKDKTTRWLLARQQDLRLGSGCGRTQGGRMSEQFFIGMIVGAIFTVITKMILD